MCYFFVCCLKAKKQNKTTTSKQKKLISHDEVAMYFSMTKMSFRKYQRNQKRVSK